MRSSSSQKGIQALFTPRRDRSRRHEAIGLTAVVAGTLVWAWALLIFMGSAETAILTERTSSSIVLLSIALTLIASGSTVFAYSRGSKRETEEDDITGPLIREVEALSRGTETPQDLGGSRRIRRGRSGSSALAVIEGLLIILLYFGLLREYDSSIYMQGWVQANIPIATIFLNDNIFFLMIGILIASALFKLASRHRSC